VTNVYIGNFFFVAMIGLLITAQWEMALGNGFAYTVFSAFGKSRASIVVSFANNNRSVLWRIWSYHYSSLWRNCGIWDRYSSAEQCPGVFHD